LNNLLLKVGFLDTASNKPLKIKPIPVPTPDKAIVPKPAKNSLNFVES
jgi:hypothetical protein